MGQKIQNQFSGVKINKRKFTCDLHHENIKSNFNLTSHSMLSTFQNIPKEKSPLLFKSGGLDTQRRIKFQKKLNFNNYKMKSYPKTALNHTSVFLNRTGNFEDILLLDEVADENVDESSLSRVSDKIVERGSITNKLNKSLVSPFNSSHNRKHSFRENVYKPNSNYITVNLNSPSKNPFKNYKGSIISSGYSPPVRFGNRRETRENIISRLNYNAIGNRAIIDRISERFMRIADKLQKKKKMELIQVYI